jgi:SAM-dependent methyltransferase
MYWFFRKGRHKKLVIINSKIYIGGTKINFIHKEDIMEQNIKSDKFWIGQWKQSIDSDTSKISKGYITPEFWDNMAKDYDKDFNEKEQLKLDKLADLLENKGLLPEHAEVLDIGCGTGRLAITLAGRGANVTALDISGEMLSQLEKNIPCYLPGKIDTLRIRWDEVDLEKNGWKHRFDLVTASMTPAVQNPDAFLKMIDASRGGCYYKAWAEKQRSRIISDLWRTITGEILRDGYAPVIYAYNLIFTMGLYPEIFFEEIERERKTALTDAVTSNTTYFKGIFGDKIENIEKIVEDYLNSIAQNGEINELMNGKSITMIWKNR